MLLLRFPSLPTLVEFYLIVLHPSIRIHLQVVSHELEVDVHIQTHREELLVAILSHDVVKLEFHQIKLPFQGHFPNRPHLVSHGDVSAHQLCPLELGHYPYFIYLSSGIPFDAIQQISVILRRLLVKRRKELVRHDGRRIDVHVQKVRHVGQLPTASR